MSDIDQLQAGPELDRRIHREIFGGVVDHRWIRWGEGLYHVCLWCGGQFRDGTAEPKGCGVTPPYSTEIAAAWLVVEKEHLSISEVLMPSGQHWMAFNWLGGDDMSNVASAPTAPIAICRAALKAVAKA
jgi:hypothetical protein